MGGDQSVTNKSGNNYTDALQASTQRSRLYKLSLGPLAGGSSTDVYAWVFDLAAGSASASAAPVMVLYNPSGVGNTWDFPGDGSLFQNGIFVVLSKVAPTDATTTPTAAGNNQAIVKLDIRVG